MSAPTQTVPVSGSQTGSAARRKIVFISSHPIQYYVPLYRAATDDQQLDVEVWYCTPHGLKGETDREFGREVKWDLPMLDGYDHVFLKNLSPIPSIYRFFGAINLGVIFGLLRQRKLVVVVPGWKLATYVMMIWVAPIFGHRVFLRCEASAKGDATKRGWKTKLRRVIFRWGLRPFIDRFLYIGTQNRRFYENNGIRDDQLVFSPYSVDNRFFAREAEHQLPRREQLRAELGIAPNANVFLFCGKLIDKKRPLDALVAFRQADIDNAHLVFVGDGALMGELKKRIEAESIQRVHQVGFVNQSQISQYYAIADALILCSDSTETWGLVANEAMNFSVAPIVSDAVGCAEDLAIEGVGMVYALADVDGLADSMRTFCNLPKVERAEVRRRCKSLIDNYSIDAIVESLQVDR